VGCTPLLGCEGSTPLLIGSGHGAPWGWDEQHVLLWSLLARLLCLYLGRSR
jgi:hypothetical protein